MARRSLLNGMLFFEVGIGQADEVLRIMRANGFGDIQIVKDLHGIPAWSTAYTALENHLKQI